MKLPFGAAVALTVWLLASVSSAQTSSPSPAQPAPAAGSSVKTVGADAKSKAGPNTLTCNDFQRNTDGSWSPTHDLTIRRAGLIVTIKPGESFGPGVTIIGLPLADMLDKQC
jgi:hypothetical protein